jgi:restriction system protein
MSRLKDVKRRWDDAFAQAHWADVERMLADHYRDEGWQVEHCGTGGSGVCFDGGIDLKLRRHGRYVVVQCKHWNVKQVPHNAVHELLGVMHTEGAAGAIIVTSGEFTPAALRAAARAPAIELIDGVGARAMLGQRMAVPSFALPDVSRWDPVIEVAGQLAARAFDLPSPRPRTRAMASAVGALLAVKSGAFLLLVGMFAFSAWLIQGAVTDFGRRNATRVQAMTPSPASAVNAPPGAVSPVAQDLVRRQPRPTSPDPGEWQRRNEEAMRVLERSTPELARMPTPEEVEAARRRNESMD